MSPTKASGKTREGKLATRKWASSELERLKTELVQEVEEALYLTEDGFNVTTRRHSARLDGLHARLRRIENAWYRRLWRWLVKRVQG